MNSNQCARPSSKLLIIALLVFTRPCLAEQVQPASPFILGYAQQLSVAPGEDVSFAISASAPVCALTIFRMGAEKKELLRVEGIAVQQHPIPDRASSHGCDWPTAYTLNVPEDWRSGYYVAQLTSQGEGSAANSQAMFVVRAKSPGTNSKILLQLSTNTYNAYTNWGGHSLYGYHDRDGIQGHRVSFDRPLSSQFDKWELPFVRWAESNGFVLDYAVNSDLEFHPEILKA